MAAAAGVLAEQEDVLADLAEATAAKTAEFAGRAYESLVDAIFGWLS